DLISFKRQLTPPLEFQRSENTEFNEISSQCLLVALNGHSNRKSECPFLGDKRTSRGEAPMVQGIDNIGMCTTDVERLIAFYQKLGFSEEHRNDRGVMMAASTVNLFIFATQQISPPPVRRELGLFGNPPGIDHISLAVADVDALY